MYVGGNYLFGLGGTFSPMLRASERPIAIACFGFVTFFPLRPLFNFPRCISCISVLTCLPAFGLYLRPEPLFEEDFFEELFLAEDFFEDDFFVEVRLDEDFFAGAFRLLRFLLEDFFADDFRPDFLLAFFVAMVKPPVRLEYYCTNFVAWQDRQWCAIRRCG